VELDRHGVLGHDRDDVTDLLEQGADRCGVQMSTPAVG
jgi:hypothetical protein